MRTTLPVLSLLQKKIHFSRKLDIILLFFFTLAVYINNLSPSVYGGDSGDFVTAALSRGVAHPSGYPLYTILGIVLTSLPLPFTPAWKFGLASGLLSSLTVVFIYLITYELTKNRYLGIITSLTLAFTYPFWLHAEIVEVMTLNSLFISVLIFLVTKYIKKREDKLLYYLAGLVGLSLTNNLTILLLFPGIFIVLLLADKKIFLKIRLMLKMFAFFILGLTPYLYIPISAQYNPSVNWGQAVNLRNFWFLIARRDYTWVSPVPYKVEVILNSLRAYIEYWSIYITLLVPILALLGIIYVFIKRKYKLAVLLITSYLFFGPLFLVYSNAPLDNLLRVATFEKFYIAGVLILIIFLPFGVLLVNEYISKILRNKYFIKYLQRVVLVVFSIIPISLFITNFHRTNLSSVYVGDNYALDILSTLPQNSVLLLVGDNTSFNSLYLQFAFNIRHDVYIPGRHEGFTQILKEAGLSEEEIKNYQIEKRSGVEKELMASVIAPLLTKRPIFSDTNREMFDSQYGKIVSIPYGLLYKLEFEDNLPYAKEKYISEITKITSLYHINALREHEDLLSYNLILADIKKWYSIAYFRIGEYIFEEYGDLEGAAEFVQLAGELDPLI